MSIKFLCVYGDSNNHVSIKRNQLARLPIVTKEADGEISKIKIELKRDALLKYKPASGPMKSVANLNSLNLVKGVDFSTKNKRYYFDVKSNAKMFARALKNGNTEITIRTARQKAGE